MRGKGTNSKESTAAKASKDAVFLNSTAIDFVELPEVMDLLVLSMSKPRDVLTTPESV